MHGNQGPQFERNYIIAKAQKRDEHGASFQSSPKIYRMLVTRLICIQWKFTKAEPSRVCLVCYTAVFSVVTQRPLKNGCVACRLRFAHKDSYFFDHLSIPLLESNQWFWAIEFVDRPFLHFLVVNRKTRNNIGKKSWTILEYVLRVWDSLWRGSLFWERVKKFARREKGKCESL